MHRMPAFGVLSPLLSHQYPKPSLLNSLRRNLHLLVPCALTGLCVQVNRCMPKGAI
jgi:hypothetical protein